jgi:hypothetical protein
MQQAEEIVLGPPVRGCWAIYNPPGHPALAFDFLAVDNNKSLYKQGGFLRHLTRFISVEDTYTWGCPVYSPVDGRVVACHDAVADREKISVIYDLFFLLWNKPHETEGFGAFGGNYLMIKAKDYYVLLCHLKENSSTVNVGDEVRIGQKLGEVGNSGASIRPHLHMQVMHSNRYFPLFANLLPFQLSKGQVKHGAYWVYEDNIVLRNRGHYYF